MFSLSAELMEIIDISKPKGWTLIVGCDANSHHIVWGNSDVNSRGEALLNTLLQLVWIF